MKKFLPKTNNNPAGFTLIELLIVVAIVAILASIGFAAFRGLSGTGRDAKRKADLEAIGNALELNKDKGGTGYQSLTDNQFASGTLPKDPISTKVYCITYTKGTLPVTIPSAVPGAWAADTCSATANTSVTSTSGGVDDIAWTPLLNTTPVTTTVAWRVCATLEDGATVICRNSAQQ